MSIALARVGSATMRRDWLGPWAVWAAMTVLGLGCVAIYGLRMPFADEWRWVPVVTGDQPCSLGWLLSFDNEHRLVLPKLIYLGLSRVSGGSFRCGTFFNVALLAAAAALLLATVRAQRGRLRWSDGFFPLLLLNGAQFDNLYWGFQLHFVVSVVLILVVLGIVFRLGDTLRPDQSLLIAAALVAASLSGAYGLAFVPPLACWMAYAALAGARRRGGRPSAAAIGGLAVLLAAAMPLWWIGYPGSSEHLFPAAARSSVGIDDRLAVGLQVLSVGFGPAAKALWPISGLLAGAACLASLGQLAVVAWKRPADRLRALGMIAVLAGTVSLALAVGWSRAFLGPRAGFESRYVTLLIPLVCLLYLQAEAFSSRRSAWIQNALCLFFCLLAAVGGVRGLRGAATMLTPSERLRADAQAGLSDQCLARRHARENFILAKQDEFAAWLSMLRRRGWPPFDGPGWAPDPSLCVLPITAPETLSLLAGKCLRLTAGERRAEVFVPERSGRIWRIDVQLGRWQMWRAADEFAWQLRRVEGGRVVAEGRYDYRQCDNARWASLPVDDVSVEPGVPLELRLEVPRDTPAGRWLEVPLFTGDAAARGEERLVAFVYLRVSGGAAP